MDGDKSRPFPISLSAVLPAYNEAGNLEAVTAELRAALATIDPDAEIIIVDDGSDDATGGLADRLAAEVPGLRALHHDRNRGYGAALRTGFAAATREWVFFMDADGQFDPADLAALVGRARERDLVAGVRARRMDPWSRRLYGRLFTLIARVVFGVHSSDINCAFKLIRRSRLAAARLTADGALINVELLWELQKQGVVPLELPVTHRPRRVGRQTGGSPRVILRAMAELLRLRLRR